MNHPRVFLDTNIWLYEFDTSAPKKQSRATEVIHAPNQRITVSTQVLQEFYVIATGKFKMSPYDAEIVLERLATRKLIIVKPTIILEAVQTSVRYQVSFWDALIIEAAAASRCQVVLTEDMQHGQTIRGVRIENPFLT